MIKNFQFADLNIRFTGNKEKTINLVKRAIRMGYDSVAINVDVGLFFCPELKNVCFVFFFFFILIFYFRRKSHLQKRGKKKKLEMLLLYLNHLLWMKNY